MTKTGADLIEKQTEKWVNMEYDWKRVPYGIREVTMIGWQREDLRSYEEPRWHKHICFSTRPLTDVEQFRRLRAIWYGYTNKRKECLKDRGDMARYASYANSQMPLIETSKNKYLRKEKPDIQRLKTQLPRAIRHSKAGFVWKPDRGWLTPTEWARTLNELFEKHDVTHSDSEYGVVRDSMKVRFTDQDFRNAEKTEFVPQSVPRTALTIKLMEHLKSLHERFKDIRVDEILASSSPVIDESEFNLNKASKCPLIRNFKKPDYIPPTVVKASVRITTSDSDGWKKKALVDAVGKIKEKLEKSRSNPSKNG
jgi:hypothetical protein